MAIRLGILGASGKVGSELIRLLENWSQDELPLACPPKLFGSSKSKGKQLQFRGQQVTVLDSLIENLNDLDLIISCANGEVSEKVVPEALKRGCKLVIDTDSYYRMDANVPLVVVGVNDEDIDWHKGIIAGPNCSTAQLVLPLKVLHEGWGLRRVVVSTYQSVSGAGKAAMDQLVEEVKETSKNYDITSSVPLKLKSREQFAFNVIPKISKFLDNGYTKEEWKVIVETRKMLHVPDLAITCTAVRVPVLVGHSESVNLQLLSAFKLDEVLKVLRSHDGIQLWDEAESFPVPFDAAGTNPVHVGRVRIDESAPNALNMWVVADNLLIGAALNALRIAATAYKRGKIS